MSYGVIYPGSYLGQTIGGGSGCTTLYTSAMATFIATTEATLRSGLIAAHSGDIVYVADSTTITVTSMDGGDWALTLSGGVILAGGRGNSGITAGCITAHLSNDATGWDYLVKATGPFAKVCGLELKGLDGNTSGTNRWGGINAQANNVEVYNCEVHDWPYAGVSFGQDTISGWVHFNDIHNCRQDGHGYGVELIALDFYHQCSVLIEGNAFDYCRHVVAGQDGLIDYEARYNYLGEHAASETAFDQHGCNDGGENDLDQESGEYIYCAGRTTLIHHNTVDDLNSNGLVGIRGTPHSTGKVHVYNNVIRGSNDPAYIIQYMFRLPAAVNAIDYLGAMVTGSGYDAFVRMSSWNNFYGPDAPPGYPISVGPGATDRASTVANAGYTDIDLNNPADGSGTLQAAAFTFTSNATGVKVGTFYRSATSNTYLTCRDSRVLAPVAAGPKQIITTDSGGTALAIQVRPGDFIGLYIAGGMMKRDTTGYSSIMYLNADKCNSGDVAEYTEVAGDALAIDASGATPAAAPEGGSWSQFGKAPGIAFSVVRAMPGINKDDTSKVIGIAV